ncbi:MAG: hypothetical protein ACRD3W_03210 [Terriglobales bacterium]
MTLDVAIETDRDGEPVVVFPGKREELIPPQPYDQRLEWIASSFNKFLGHVHEIERIRSAPVVN